MSRQEELENLTTAYYLEDTLLILNRDLNELNHNIPKAPRQPLKPTENQHYATYLNEQVLDIQEHGNKLLRSISNWQKADILINEHRYQKRQQAIKKAKQ